MFAYYHTFSPLSPLLKGGFYYFSHKKSLFLTIFFKKRGKLINKTVYNYFIIFIFILFLFHTLDLFYLYNYYCTKPKEKAISFFFIPIRAPPTEVPLLFLLVLYTFIKLGKIFPTFHFIFKFFVQFIFFTI